MANSAWTKEEEKKGNKQKSSRLVFLWASVVLKIDASLSTWFLDGSTIQTLPRKVVFQFIYSSFHLFCVVLYFLKSQYKFSLKKNKTNLAVLINGDFHLGNIQIYNFFSLSLFLFFSAVTKFWHGRVNLKSNQAHAGSIDAQWRTRDPIQWLGKFMTTTPLKTPLVCANYHLKTFVRQK